MKNKEANMKNCEHYKTCGMDYCNSGIEREGTECPDYMSKMKPILFNGEMVKAILDGRKTVTRRLIKPQPGDGVRKSVFVKSGVEDLHGYEVKTPYKVGDVLYVRETYQRDPDGFNEFPPEDWWVYQATNELPKTCTKWRPSIHMPREAARIFLKVTDVKVEIAQDISEMDAIKEGFYSRVYFMSTFCDLYGVDIYEKTWVWVIEFERCEGGKHG